MNKRQLGKFRLDVLRIEDNVDELCKIMATVIPVRAEYMYETNCIEYIALSHSFAPVGLGFKIPWYRAVFTEGVLSWETLDE